jgi:SAM-dependent methyltransferase
MQGITYPTSSDALARSALLNQYWYYTIELLPGLVTPGAGYLNFGLTRRLLAKCDVKNRSVLDVGTMEAAIPLLAHRQAARKAVGVDIAQFDEKIAAVQHYTGTQFDYYSGLIHGTTVSRLKEKGHSSFDIVVLSGVLYHAFGPLNTLAVARSLVRTGGLMIVETWATADQEQGMFFNTGGRFTSDPSTYFLITVPLLDYVLRYFKLQPIDCIYGLVRERDSHKTMRVSTVCRAVNDIPAGDNWMREATKIVDYVTLIDWDSIEASGRDPVAYADEDDKTDLYNVVSTKAPTDLSPVDAVIKLSDRR